MNYQEYAPLAIRTAKRLGIPMDMRHAYMGVVTEVGELVDAFKKHYVYGKPLDLENVIEEIGDTFWYLNLLWEATDSKPSQLYDTSAFRISHIDHRESVIDCMLSLAETAGNLKFNRPNTAKLQAQLEAVCISFNIDLGLCLDRNIAKLAARYGDKYSDYKAVNRDLVVERKLLEG